MTPVPRTSPAGPGMEKPTGRAPRAHELKIVLTPVMLAVYAMRLMGTALYSLTGITATWGMTPVPRTSPAGPGMEEPTGRAPRAHELKLEDA